MKSENRNQKTAAKRLVRYLITIKGIVQGVGFRPFVYNLAREQGIKGTVLNSSRGVIVDAEGDEADVKAFIKTMREHPPVLARIGNITVEEMPVAHYETFRILKSDPGREKEVLIPPDTATCSNCLRDIEDPSDRHFRYPFTNCTHCGPRFSIIREIPYDRPNTSMAAFGMCGDCGREYHDPSDRRFHAQPVACPQCGPRVELVRKGSGERRAESVAETGNTEDWLPGCWDILRQGGIIDLKGIGGFHLACDGKNRTALKRLRTLKGREYKPFAVMCRDIAKVKEYCYVSKEEEELLLSPQAPVVILERKSDALLPEELAPNLISLGVMLPYSPLHFLLFSGDFDILVMTSGNYSGLPLVKDNDRALAELGSIADAFILHNRDIVNRCDDSVVEVIDNETHFFRRSRGYVPQPFPVPRKKRSPVILGVGGEMKNTFCLLKGDQAFMSQYIGEIDSLEGEENLLQGLLHFQALIGVEPYIVAFDAHPDYASARIARLIHGESYEGVQHHHAHLASCMAENNLSNEETIGIILDGTGYGTDGNLWGFEFLAGNYTDFERICHLAYVPLPGGEAAIREPWRAAVSYLLTFLGDRGREYAGQLFRDKEIGIVEEIVARRFNTPLACGCGRIFDAVSAILDVCRENTYEGQAAIELAELAHDTEKGPLEGIYGYSIEQDVVMPDGILEGVVSDVISGVPADRISVRFHNTLVRIIADTAERIRAERGLRKVVLSGGTWHNRYLLMMTKRILRDKGFDVYYHRLLPPNDGCISLGQAMVAHWRHKEQRRTKGRERRNKRTSGQRR